MPRKKPATPRKRKICASTLPIILRVIWERPMTLHQLMEATETGIEGITSFVRSMHAERMIHIVDWSWQNSRPVPVYAFGPGEDADRQWTRSERKVLAVFGDDLTSRTAEEVAQKLGVSRSLVARSMSLLVNKGMLIRNTRAQHNALASWRRNPNVPLPALGPSEWHAALEGKEPAKPRLRVKPQSWFSAIA
jgi:biotin operon repressor